MSIKSILSVLCILLIAASCSMEDDLLNGVGMDSSDVTSAPEVYAAVDLSLLGGTVKTKSSEYGDPTTPNGLESSVWSFFVAVLNAGNDEVLTTYYCNQTQSLGNDEYGIGGSPDSHFIFKVPASKPQLKFYVIANVYNGGEFPDNVTNLKACKNLSDLKNAELVNVDPNILPKSGMRVLDSYTTYQTRKEITGDYTKLRVPVSQRTARIQLAGITVNGQSVNNITVSSLKLSNRKQYGLVDAEFVATSNEIRAGWSFTPFGEDSKGIHPGGEPGLADYPNIYFYTYENSSLDFTTTLDVEYRIGNEATRTYSFEIQTPEKGKCVVAGTIYELYLNVTKLGADIKWNIVEWDSEEINRPDFK